MKKRTRKMVGMVMAAAVAAGSANLPAMSVHAENKTVNIDFSKTDGEMNPKTGWLIIPNEVVPDGRIIPLNTQVVRDDFDTQNLLGSHAGNNTDKHMADVLPNERNRLQRVKHGKERLDELGVDEYYPIMAYMPSWISQNGRPQSPPADYALWKQWVKDIAQYMKDSDLNVYEYNVWNENWAINTTYFNNMYGEAWDAVREVSPDNQLIGPSPSTSDWGAVKSLIDYCADEGITLDNVAWHFGDYNSLGTFQQQIAEYVGQNPSVGDPEYYYEEYTGPGDVNNLTAEFKVLANFDRADIDKAIRGVWTDINGLSDMLATNAKMDGNPYGRKAIWWLMTTYGAMSGTRVQQSGDDLYVASYDDEKGEAKILIGNQSGDVTLNMSAFPFAGESVRIDKYRITDVENDGLQFQGSDGEFVAGETVSTDITFADTSDIWMIEVKKTESAPSDFALQGPDDGLAAELQPEFTWQEAQGAESYDLVVSESKDLSSPVYTKKGIEGTSHKMEDMSLEDGKTYYWSVTAHNAYGAKEPYQGMYYSFVASESQEIPGPFTILQVIDEDYGTELMPKVTWTEAAGAEQYVIHISEKEDFAEETTITLEADGLPSNDIGQGNRYVYHILTEEEKLNPETHYYIKVEAKNESGSRAMNGTAHEFTTTTADGMPAEFNTTFPENGGTADPRFTLRWERTLGAFFYQLEIAKDPEFKDIALKRDTITVPAYTMEANILEPETTYYWRVTAADKQIVEGKPSVPGEKRTVNGNGVQSFTTSAVPTAPILKTSIPVSGGALVEFEPVNEADSYVVKYGTESGVYESQAETSDTMTYIPLEEGKTYYYTVVSVRNGIESDAWGEMVAEAGASGIDEVVLGERLEAEQFPVQDNTVFTAADGASGSLAVRFTEPGQKIGLDSLAACGKMTIRYQADQDTSAVLYRGTQKEAVIELEKTGAAEWKEITIEVPFAEGESMELVKETNEAAFNIDYIVLSENKEETVNLAPESKITADSELNSSYGPGKVIDGSNANDRDFWVAGTVPTEESPNWLAAELPADSEIYSVEIALPNVAAWTPRTQNIRVLVSDDGSEYREVSARKDYVFDLEQNDNRHIVFESEQPVSASFVKVEIYFNTEGAGQIGELYINGVKNETPSADDNLALGKAVIAEATSFGNAANITDGDPLTFWDGGKDTFPNYVTVDLGRNYRLSEVEVALPPQEAWTPRQQELEILVSEDGKEFFTVKEKTGYKFSYSENDNQVTIPLEDEPVGRYIQIAGYSNDEPSEPGVQIGELTVRGTYTPVSGIEIPDSEQKLSVGETRKIEAEILPAEAEDQRISWSSSDNTVASVDDDGVVTANGVGECIIRARTIDGGYRAECTVTVVGEAGECNKELLQKTYDYALTLETDGVTDSAKAFFEKVLAEAKAVLDDANATQDEVNKAWDNLLEGIWGLGIVRGDTAMLELLIERADAMAAEKDRYVETNWQQFEDALAAAKAAAENGDATQDVVDEAADNLLNAILAQRYKADKDNLKALVDKAEGLELSAYTKESADVLRTALKQAKAVLEDDALSTDDQTKVDQAAEELQAAINGLELSAADGSGSNGSGSGDDGSAGSGSDDDSNAGTGSGNGEKGTEAADEAGKSVPKTGDEGRLFEFGVVFLAAAAALAGCIRNKVRSPGNR